jgi:hypothetical protein
MFFFLLLTIININLMNVVGCRAVQPAGSTIGLKKMLTTQVLSSAYPDVADVAAATAVSLVASAVTALKIAA